MKKIIAILALSVLASCSMTQSVQISSAPVGKKTGEACASMLFGLFNVGGDNYVHTAARNGKIKKISGLNHKISGLYPIFYSQCTIVSGK